MIQHDLPVPYAEQHGITVYQGDVLAVLRQLPSEMFDLIATSPPYNSRKSYDSIVDEWEWPSYYAWLGQVLDECYRVLRTGGTLAINTPGVIRYQQTHPYRASWRDFDAEVKTHRDGQPVIGRGRIEPLGFHLYQMMFERDPHLREPIVWVKAAAEGEAFSAHYQMGSDSNPYLRACHEFIWLGSKGQWHHRGGRGQRGAAVLPFDETTKDVWRILPEADTRHPAVWPLEIPRRLIRLFCHASDSKVLDPFAGRGTTLQAAHEAGIEAVGIEISPRYCRLAQHATAQGHLFRLSALPEAVA
jgi:DNA modification methylase